MPLSSRLVLRNEGCASFLVIQPLTDALYSQSLGSESADFTPGAYENQNLPDNVLALLNQEQVSNQGPDVNIPATTLMELGKIFAKLTPDQQLYLLEHLDVPDPSSPVKPERKSKSHRFGRLGMRNSVRREQNGEVNVPPPNEGVRDAEPLSMVDSASSLYSAGQSDLSRHDATQPKALAPLRDVGDSDDNPDYEVGGVDGYSANAD